MATTAARDAAPSARTAATAAPAVDRPARAPAAAPRSTMLPTAPPAVRLSTAEPATATGTGLAPGLTPRPTAGGDPLAPAVRSSIERSLRGDLPPIRVHTDARAQQTARLMSARAVTYGRDILLGPGERPTDLALMAHEAAHVVQQEGAPTPQRFGTGSNDPCEREAHHAADAVVRGEPFTPRERTGGRRFQRLGISDALDYFADKANVIPGFRMFTIVLGVNPINMSPVDRNGANILRAVVELLPGGGLITQALDNSGVFEKVAAWIAQQLQTLGLVGSSIKQAIMDFLDSLSWTDIFHLGDVWDRAKRILTDPIDRIINFAKGLIDGIIQFIKTAILIPIGKLAQGTAGYDLLKAVLGEDPVTGEKVPQSAETIIPPFMKLIGQEDVWQRMQKANAIPRAFAWFKGAMAAIVGFVTQIPTLFVNAFKALTLEDIILVPKAFAKLVGVFGGFLGRFVSWALNAVWNLLEIIFDVISPGALFYIKKTGAALKSILKNPLPFVGNLVKAAKLGFLNFGANFGTHLKAGLIDWLTGSLPGVYIPRAFTLSEIVKFVLSVFGLTWQDVRAKLVKVVGEPVVKALETGFDIVITLVREGPAAAWDKITEQLSNLKDMVIGGITDFVVDMVVNQAVPKLVALFIPGAGFISAILSIYDTIMVFVHKISKIVQVVTGFINSIAAIASGAIAVAASRVEKTLAGLLSLAISFLAGFIHLGNVADKVMGVIEKVRAPIDKALDFLIAWIVTTAKKLFAKLFEKKDKPDERTEAAKRRDKLAAIADAEKLLPDEGFNEEHVRGELALIKSRYRLSTLTLVVDARSDQTETVHFTASASDEEKGSPKQVKLAPVILVVTPVPVGSWIKNAETNSYEQVTSGTTVVKRTATGVDAPVSFSAAMPGGGSNQHFYRDENAKWSRTNFSHGSKLVVPTGAGQFMLVPAKRGRDVIRPEFYGDSQTIRNSMKDAKLPSLKDPANPTQFFSQGNPAQEARFGYKIDPATGHALVPVEDASADHEPSIAEHWSNRQGNNEAQAARESWNKNPTTYQIISGSLNSSLSGKGATYTDLVGINFRGPGE